MTKNLKVKWPAAFGVAVAVSLSAMSAGALAQDHRNDNHGGPGQGQQQNAPGPQNGGPGNSRPDQGRGDNNGPGGHGNVGHSQPQPQARNYEFRDQDRQQLRSHYARNLKNVKTANRPHFQRGERIPQSYRSHITPVPASVRRGLPPPPAGYQVGYYQGYSVVYDPTTYVILSVLDLLAR